MGVKTMTPKTKYDLNQFRKLVKSGKTKKEIMEEMGIKGSITFNNLKLRLYETDGKVYKIKDKDGRISAVHVIRIGKGGKLPISSKALEDSGFKEGDKFNLKTTKKGITLTLVKE